MASKRSSSYLGSDGSDQDPDYAMVTSSHPVKKQKLHQQDAKDTTVKKIENIIKKHFSVEIKNKEKEIDLADERIHQVRMMLDKLRACVVANFYGNAGRCPGSEKTKHKIDLNHPAVQRALGTNLDSTIGSRASPDSLQAQDQQNGLVSELEVQRKDDELPPYTGEIKAGDRRSQLFSTSGQASRFHLKKRIIVGNVSKYITTENREDSDPSTHKWMVYVRGPTEEPRIDHFVKKVWFYLHPSYRPNDLVEVKDPPFHLTRRGWGEFPIRVQLHFNDPRSKKVDIIHHLKLDRTYTGLQTLGAETIVDVELDRYLFDEEEATLSRPSTPTVTKVNYREGFKAGLSRTPPSLRSSPSIFSTKSSSPQTSDDQRSTPASSPISEMSRGSSRRGTPVTLDDSFGVASRSSTPSPSLTNKVQIQSGMIVNPTGRSPDQTEGKFIQVLPTSSETNLSSTITKTARSILDMPKLSLSTSLNSTGKKIGEGKSGLSWRIEEGKLLEVQQGKKVSTSKSAMTMGFGVAPLQSTPSKIVSKSKTTLPSLKAIGQSTAKSSAGPSQMTLLGRQTVKSLLGSQKGSTPSTSAGSLQVVSNTPPGAQYYITAKSTDPNLQGKVILIPHQVFAQASTQQPGGGKTIQKTTAKTTGGKGKSSFLSPSNVLILPQGSIVPPLPPGSIVQIQQVPSPARTAQPQTKFKSSTTLPKAVGAQPVVTVGKGTIPVIPSSSGVGKPPLTKVVQTAGVAKPAQSGGVSLLPDIKSQLARPPSGGVILVQRMPSQPKPANTQVGPGIQKITVSQAQLGKSATPTTSAQGQSQSKLSQAQTIILQSPTTSPTRTSSGKSLQVMSLPQGSKRVLTEPAQTLPVSEGTVEITRTLTETVAEVKPSPQTTSVLNEVIVTKTRSPATTSYARLPGLSPIKPPPSASQAASTILIKKEVNQDGKKLEGLQQQQAVHVKKLPSDGKPPPQLKDPRKAIGAVQVVTVTEKGGEEKITIKAEPIDDYPEVSKMKGPPPLQLITTPQTISNKQITSRIISPQPTTIQGLPVKNPQDGVLKVSADPLMKQEISSTLATENRAITRLADPTSRVIITKLTSPAAASPSSKPMVGQGSLGEQTVKSSPSGPSSMLMVSGSSSSQPAASSSSSLMVTQSARSSTPGTAVVGAVRIKQESGTESRIQHTAAAPPAKAQTYLDQPQLLRWCAKLNLKVTDGISLYQVEKMEQLIENIVKVRPLFSENRKIEELPYSALNLQEFQSWPVGKKRAAEWQRALDVRRSAYRVIHKVVALWEVKIWSTKKIMRWCREHGYTPRDTDLYRDTIKGCDLCGVFYRTEDSKSHRCQIKCLTDIGILRKPTYSIPDDWCKALQDVQKSKEMDADDDIVLIDVVSVSPGERKKQVTKREIKVEEEARVEQRIRIPQSHAAQFVTDETNKIGIHFDSLEVSEGVYAPVVEEMISAATKCFLSEILHKSHKAAYDSQQQNRIPSEIHPAHIYQAIRETKLLDFLTNQKLGVKNEVPSNQKS